MEILASCIADIVPLEEAAKTKTAPKPSSLAGQNNKPQTTKCSGLYFHGKGGGLGMLRQPPAVGISPAPTVPGEETSENSLG